MSHDLSRFLDAQNDGTYERALAELRGGRKTSHWMWFVFPQVRGLGTSPMAQKYAISGRDEAQAYLADDVLGPRLVESATAVIESGVTDPAHLLGGIDAIKLRSSMTLFEAAADAVAYGASDAAAKAGLHITDDADIDAVTDHPTVFDVFSDVLDTLYDGVRDRETLNRL